MTTVTHLTPLTLAAALILPACGDPSSNGLGPPAVDAGVDKGAEDTHLDEGFDVSSPSGDAAEHADTPEQDHDATGAPDLPPDGGGSDVGADVVEDIRVDPAEDTDVPDAIPDVEEAVCPEGVTCLDEFPAQIVDTTRGAPSTMEAYSCAPLTDEGGPERIIRVELATDGFFAVEITDEEPGSDVDVHILRELDAGTCIDRGNYTAAAALEAGIYWVIADTWVDSDGHDFSGQYELSLNLTTAEDLVAHGLSEEAARDALTVFTRAWEGNETRRFEYSITDFSLHSSQWRLWIVSLSTGALLYQLHVGHGEASIVGDDLGWASVFSNLPGSHQSSLGLVRTAETYTGNYGYSLRIDGLEPGFNDNVRARAIVVHPWFGSDPEVIASQGWATPSWGCATIDPALSAEVIDTILDESLMLFWYPDATWRGNSAFLN